jgi:hypothetical protein
MYNVTTHLFAANPLPASDNFIYLYRLGLLAFILATFTPEVMMRQATAYFHRNGR